MRELEPFTIVDLARAPIALAEVESARAGRVEAGAEAVARVWGAEIGVWEMTVGAMRDVEVDEAFVVLSGHATVTLFEEAGERTISLSPGALCRLSAGMRTRWDVTSTLRKVYLLPPSDSSPPAEAIGVEAP